MNSVSKTGAIISLLLFSGISMAKVNYDPSQFQQFEKTSQCVGCDLSSVVISYKSFPHADLDKTNLSNANAILTNLSNATLTNANLTGINFEYANLSGADFQGSVLYGSNFENADLYQANVTAQQLTETSSVCGATLPDGSPGKCN